MKIQKYLDNPLELLFTVGIRGGFRFLGDEAYIRMMYRCRFRKKINLSNPETFNEKLQWMKLNDRNPLYTKLVDKYEVKKYVADLIGKEYVIPTLGVWESFDDINFMTLPNQFVLKCTHDSGGLIICKDKTTFDVNAAKKKIKSSMKRNYYWAGREWPYKDVKPRIIAEIYMNEDGHTSLTDFKFFCFNNVPQFLYISEGLDNHSTAAISFFDFNGKRLPFAREDYAPFLKDYSLPGNFSEMLDIARKCAGNINNAFSRIDLYSIKGKVYFSEITFSPCGGFIPFMPIEWDYKVGKLLNLDNKQQPFVPA